MKQRGGSDSARHFMEFFLGSPGFNNALQGGVDTQGCGDRVYRLRCRTKRPRHNLRIRQLLEEQTALKEPSVCCQELVFRLVTNLRQELTCLLLGAM